FVPFLIRAMVRALGEQPDLNARLDEDSGILHRSPAVHVGVSVQTPRGAMVPVIRDACGLSLRKTAAALSRLTNAARDGSIRPDEISGSTITIRSLGHPDALLATPVLHRPEVAAIGVNRIVTRPLWDGRAFVPRKVMNLSCSFDHRAVTDGDAAAFVARLRQLLETPALIFIGE
ncbi:MAG: 2-oxo acid dehydrogenase subunit E2, partial [Paracoccus sp. (in: a-proteobacteria)]|nr:2-oxo acid dehydrogenase subunit E2 [Paracoccus sp. (in: a-proteobacteria)]